MKRRSSSAAVLTVALATFVHTSANATTYTIKDLGSLGGTPALGTNATAISNNGQIVGSSAATNGHTHAFLWSNGTMTDMTPGSTNDTYATSINALGDFCGYMLTANVPTPTGFLILHGAAPGGFRYQFPGYAFGVNRYDTIVGKDENGYAAEWPLSAPKKVLSPAVSQADSINIYGDVVGSIGATAAEWKNGVHYLTGAVEAKAISNFGVIIGVLYDQYNNPHAAQYVNGAWVAMAAPTGIGLNSAAFAVNNNGVMGGYITWYGQPHACLWTSASQFPQMGDLQVSNPISGMSLQYVAGINDNGVIAVAGTVNGQPHSFVLTPQ